MIRPLLSLLSAGCFLFAVGCAGVDDSREQSEFEELRKRPLPQGDRLLPSFEKDSSPEEEALRFAGPPVLPRNPRNF